MANEGFVQVYTGNGKGKTTAAFGLALRAAGRGLRTYVAQFMKKGEYGEVIAARNHLGRWITVEQFGLPEFHHREKGVSEAERDAALAGLEAARRAITGGEFRIVVLDEVNTLLHFDIVPTGSVLALLDLRPPGVELVLTGRYAPPEILARADLITEMAETRHYYGRGVAARSGIEK
jgi:cob(I)alamin adenosyltransferase